MTKKKENILTAALHLFARDGFASVSTSKIAKNAQVSEGLIFRHFSNKEGLLTSIMEMGQQKAQLIFKDIFAIEEPKAKLKAILSTPFSIPKEEYEFWRLMYQLKWQTDEYDNEMSDQLKQVLHEVFSLLNYEDPELEAEYAMILFDGIATSILLKNNNNIDAIKKVILKKYNLGTE